MSALGINRDSYRPIQSHRTDILAGYASSCKEESSPYRTDEAMDSKSMKEAEEVEDLGC